MFENADLEEEINELNIEEEEEDNDEPCNIIETLDEGNYYLEMKQQYQLITGFKYILQDIPCYLCDVDGDENMIAFIRCTDLIFNQSNDNIFNLRINVITNPESVKVYLKDYIPNKLGIAVNQLVHEVFAIDHPELFRTKSTAKLSDTKIMNVNVKNQFYKELDTDANDYPHMLFLSKAYGNMEVHMCVMLKYNVNAWSIESAIKQFDTDLRLLRTINQDINLLNEMAKQVTENDKPTPTSTSNVSIEFESIVRTAYNDFVANNPDIKSNVRIRTCVRDMIFGLYPNIDLNKLVDVITKISNESKPISNNKSSIKSNKSSQPQVQPSTQSTNSTINSNTDVLKLLQFSTNGHKYTNELGYTSQHALLNTNAKYQYRFNCNSCFLVDLSKSYIIPVDRIEFNIISTNQIDLTATLPHEIKYYQLTSPYESTTMNSILTHQSNILNTDILMNKVTFNKVSNGASFDLNVNHYPYLKRFIISPNNKSNHKEYYVFYKSLPTTSDQLTIGVTSYTSDVTTLPTKQ